MKKITLLFLFVATISFAQTRKDLENRTESLTAFINNQIKKHPELTAIEVYSNHKMLGVNSILKFSDEDKAKFSELFTEQYEPWFETSKKYTEIKSAQSKVDIIKLLVKNEEDFRALLTREQLATYIAHKSNVSDEGYTSYKSNFIAEDKLAEFKKELQ